MASILEEKGHKATLLDFRVDDEKTLRKLLKEVDAVGITVETTSLNNCREIVKMVREEDKDLPVIIGGPHCTIVKEKALREIEADYEVIGEGEPVIDRIADMLEGKTDESKITGLSYWKNGEIVSNGISIVKDLDELPFPAHHLVKKYDYGYIGGIKIFPGKFMSMITSRGCPFKCTFCSRRLLNVIRYRERSPENVIKEIKYLHSKGYRNIIFTDDNLLTNRKRIEKIMDMIIDEELNMNFVVEGARIGAGDIELYKKMKKAGVKLITYGIESGNQDVLDYYRKGITLEQIRETIRIADALNFITVGNFIIGAPIEDEEHIKNTIEFAKELPLDIASFFILDYMVGSELWEEKVKEGIIKPDEYIVGSDSRKGLGKLTRKELEEWRRKANLRFYLRYKYFSHEFIKFLRMHNIYLAKGISTIFACSRCIRKMKGKM